MTRLTVLIILTRDDILVEPYEENGKRGYWITFGDRHELLLSTNFAVYSSKSESLRAGELLLSEIRGADKMESPCGDSR